MRRNARLSNRPMNPSTLSRAASLTPSLPGRVEKNTLSIGDALGLSADWFGAPASAIRRRMVKSGWRRNRSGSHSSRPHPIHDSTAALAT